MVGAHQNLHGLGDPTTPSPERFVIPGPSTCYNEPIYQIWSLYLHPLRSYDRRYEMS